ncbi:MAG: phosphate signaling complex protein PhoU [Anaerolineales bacterium]
MSSLRATYDREFAAIKNEIINMGSLVETAIADSMQSLQERDQIQAQQVIDHDETINALRFKVEEACLTLIATQQPTASDLRDVIAAMSIVVEMERMADHASGIAKTVIRMGDEPPLKPLIDLPRMAQLAREMLRDGLDSFITRDVQKARIVATRDDEMDLLNRAIFDELVEIMAERPDGVERATYLLWCSHNLERIGDRVTNIVERVVFMTTGDMEDLND